MRTSSECIPCLVGQVAACVGYITQDAQLQEELLREALRALSQMDFSTSPPQMTQFIHRLLRRRTGVDDFYRQQKAQFNQAALHLYPGMRSLVRRSANPLETAVKLAIAGNVIDLGARSHLGDDEIGRAVVEALELPFYGDLADFREAVGNAADILYLTDNAGEIVFDRLLLEELPTERITVGVRGRPILNDATMDDFETAGLTSLVRVIENGSDAPGTLLGDCSPSFRMHFERADLVIAKGQGNYETLGGEQKNIYFLLKVKCPVVSRQIGCSLSSLVLRRQAESGG